MHDTTFAIPTYQYFMGYLSMIRVSRESERCASNKGYEYRHVVPSIVKNNVYVRKIVNREIFLKIMILQVVLLYFSTVFLYIFIFTYFLVFQGTKGEEMARICPKMWGL